MTPDWIAVDWGTTNLRAWAMRGSTIVGHAQSSEGMAQLAKTEFESALLRVIAPWLGEDSVPVVACGMVGSRQGWHEAPYRQVPCAPLEAGALVAVPTDDRRIVMLIAPGLEQGVPADVMRGEETQIAGALALEPGFDGILRLPGTHSKWVAIAGGRVMSFRTFMTGELFSLLSSRSVLAHSMAGDGWDDAAFDEGVDMALADPGAMSAWLFGLRAESLISGLGAAAARSRLSGLLIGVELAANAASCAGRDVALIGSDGLSARYQTALARLGVAARVMDATACTLAGLAHARSAMREAAE